MTSRLAIVTGSTSGIGLGIARRLAREGHAILLNGLAEPDEVERIRAEIAAESGVPVAFDGADMTDPAAIAAMIARAEAQFGAVDVLVNNAGIQFVSPVEDFPVERWDRIIAINLNAAFHAIRAALPGMKARRFGRIVNIASAHALIASPYKSAYVAAKHGIAGLTKTVALEAAEFGVTVNAIAPGYVLTPLVEKQIPDTAKARGITEEEVVRTVLLAAQPTKRFVAIEEVAALAAFLTGDEAGSITGAIIPIDGGWTAQ
ncbi:3-hydroxybutyrate dehydrogenase [Prosthecomicrobium hirschii]|uniref:3-hydroxybutyrate dehydrogenase n=1 Tax=Prosthecodimorpha hirschii TaxID=665126 RepID=A0A0P6VQE1_9HYPH|nr:3-hydroxybutyrate dehydrogenase [Prosthecomicrobium hirschii]KPL52717.1 3-hydroxybutyrate dehydrogenase [Prosthecomicrobium hirschii]